MSEGHNPHPEIGVSWKSRPVSVPQLLGPASNRLAASPSPESANQHPRFPESIPRSLQPETACCPSRGPAGPLTRPSSIAHHTAVTAAARGDDQPPPVDVSSGLPPGLDDLFVPLSLWPLKAPHCTSSLPSRQLSAFTLTKSLDWQKQASSSVHPPSRLSTGSRPPLHPPLHSPYPSQCFASCPISLPLTWRGEPGTRATPPLAPAHHIDLCQLYPERATRTTPPRPGDTIRLCNRKFEKRVAAPAVMRPASKPNHR